MAGVNGTDCFESIQRKIEAMSDEDFKSENIFHKSRCIKETGIKERTSSCHCIAVSGEMHNPELPDTIYLLDEKSIEHIENMLKNIQ